MRATFKGALTLRKLVVGVKAYSLITDPDTEFHWYHRTCQARLNTRYTCAACGETIEEPARVRGAELPEGLILVEDKELKALEPPDSSAIPIHSIQTLDNLPQAWYGRPYCLTPDESMDVRPYALVHRIFHTDRLGAVVTYTTRNRRHLAVVSALEGKLLMLPVVDPPAVRPLSTFNIPAPGIELTAKELAMMRRLVRQENKPVNLKRLRDPYPERVAAFLADKAAKRKPAEPKIPLMHALPPRSADLIALLTQSIKRLRPRT